MHAFRLPCVLFCTFRLSFSFTHCVLNILTIHAWLTIVHPVLIWFMYANLDLTIEDKTKYFAYQATSLYAEHKTWTIGSLQMYRGLPVWLSQP